MEAPYEDPDVTSGETPASGVDVEEPTGTAEDEPADETPGS